MGKKVSCVLAIVLPLTLALLEGFRAFLNTGERVQFVIGAAIFLFSLFVWGVGHLANAQKRSASRSWPSTSGTIEAVRAEETSRETALLSPYGMNIAYSYRADGEWYSGFETWRFRNQMEADAAVRELNGRNIIVRYNPKDPADSTLSKLPKTQRA